LRIAAASARIGPRVTTAEARRCAFFLDLSGDVRRILRRMAADPTGEQFVITKCFRHNSVLSFSASEDSRNGAEQIAMTSVHFRSKGSSADRMRCRGKSCVVSGKIWTLSSHLTNAALELSASPHHPTSRPGDKCGVATRRQGWLNLVVLKARYHA